MTPVAETPITEAPRRRRYRVNPVTLGGCLTVAVVGVFLWLIHNRYYPIQEGWFSYYAELMSRGKLPYRDFYFFTQPISLWIAQAVYTVSDHVIAMRYYGFAERLVLTAALYYFLSRRFSAPASLLATIVSMLSLLTYRTDAFFTYLMTCCLFSLACLIFLYRAFSGRDRALASLLAAGAFASLAFFAKQSNGGAMTATAFALVCWIAPSGRRLRSAAWFVSGWCLVGIPILGWLAVHGLLEPYYEQVFVGAASSKGSLPMLLVAFWLRLAGPFWPGVARPADYIVLCVALLFWLLWRRKALSAGAETSADDPRLVLPALAGGSLVCMLIPWFLPVSRTAESLLRVWNRPVSGAVFLVLLGGAVRAAYRRLRRPETDPFWLIAWVGGLAWGYSCGFSFAVEQQATVFGVAFLVALAFDRLRFHRQPVRRSVATACLAACMIFAWQKEIVAFDWLGWREPIARSGIPSHWPRLAGYETDPRLMSEFDAILDEVSRYSKPGEPVFTFPFMPMFNYVTGRPQPTFAPVHYWDVCPDWVATADAERLRWTRPRMLIVMDVNSRDWKIAEDAFRHGAKSGQRQIRAVIESMVRSGDYKLVHTWVGPGYGTPVRVWARTK